MSQFTKKEVNVAPCSIQSLGEVLISITSQEPTSHVKCQRSRSWPKVSHGVFTQRFHTYIRQRVCYSFSLQTDTKLLQEVCNLEIAKSLDSTIQTDRRNVVKLNNSIRIDTCRNCPSFIGDMEYFT